MAQFATVMGLEMCGSTQVHACLRHVALVSGFSFIVPVNILPVYLIELIIQYTCLILIFLRFNTNHVTSSVTVSLFLCLVWALTVTALHLLNWYCGTVLLQLYWNYTLDLDTWNTRGEVASMVIHLTAMQQSRVRFRHLPSPRRTLPGPGTARQRHVGLPWEAAEVRSKKFRKKPI
jgi:hypothetical protein